MGGLGMAALFSVLACAFAVIAVDAGLAGRWVIAVAAAVLATWMSTLVLTTVRKSRR